MLTEQANRLSRLLNCYILDKHMRLPSEECTPNPEDLCKLRDSFHRGSQETRQLYVQRSHALIGGAIEEAALPNEVPRDTQTFLNVVLPSILPGSFYGACIDGVVFAEEGQANIHPQCKNNNPILIHLTSVYYNDIL